MNQQHMLLKSKNISFEVYTYLFSSMFIAHGSKQNVKLSIIIKIPVAV